MLLILLLLLLLLVVVVVVVVVGGISGTLAKTGEDKWHCFIISKWISTKKKKKG